MFREPAGAENGDIKLPLGEEAKTRSPTQDENPPLNDEGTCVAGVTKGGRMKD